MSLGNGARAFFVIFWKGNTCGTNVWWWPEVIPQAVLGLLAPAIVQDFWPSLCLGDLAHESVRDFCPSQRPENWTRSYPGNSTGSFSGNLGENL